MKALETQKLDSTSKGRPDKISDYEWNLFCRTIKAKSDNNMSILKRIDTPIHPIIQEYRDSTRAIGFAFRSAANLALELVFLRSPSRGNIKVCMDKTLDIS